MGDAVKRVTKAVFAGLMRAASRMHGEEARHGVGMCLNERDVMRLVDVSKMSREHFQGAAIDWKSVVREACRTHIEKTTSEEGGEMLAASDAIGRGLTALAVVNRKLDLLASMATANDCESVTDGVRVRVRSYLMAEASKEDDYCFAYDVCISNEREKDESVTVLSRKWTIDDDEGRRQEVSGMGVVGQQPNIAAGDCFKYTSATVRTSARTHSSNSVFARSHPLPVYVVAPAPLPLRPFFRTMRFCPCRCRSDRIRERCRLCMHVSLSLYMYSCRV